MVIPLTVRDRNDFRAAASAHARCFSRKRTTCHSYDQDGMVWLNVFYIRGIGWIVSDVVVTRVLYCSYTSK